MTLLDAWYGVHASYAGHLDLRTAGGPFERPHRINLVQRLLHARIARTHITAAAGGCAASSPSHTVTDPRDPNAGNVARSGPVVPSMALPSPPRKGESRAGSACACPDPAYRQMSAAWMASQRVPLLSLRPPASGQHYRSSCSEHP